VYTPILFPIRATCHSHLIHLDLITQIISGEESKSLSSSLCSFLHSPVTPSIYSVTASTPYVFKTGLTKWRPVNSL
jgi:hypothetical protein